MKFKNLDYILLSALVLTASCKKEYLDRKPYNAVVLSSAITSEADVNVALNGAYAQLRATDLYGRTLPVKGDVMADNAYVTTANSGRYLTMNNFVFNNSDAYALGIWQQAYVAIKYANTVINTTVATTANITQYQGEALAIRALMHFELIRNYAHPYTVAPNDLGVPIVTSYNQNALPKRSTVKEVYTQVIADLEKAYSMLTLYRGTAFFSKYAVRALEARVYQNMGDWANAKTAALEVINSSGWALLPAASYVSPSGTTATTYSPGGYWANPVPQTSTKNETLFEVSADLASNNGFDQIGFIYLTTGGGYGDILGTADLYTLYAMSTTDVRRGLFPVGTRSGQAGTVYLNYKYPNAANGTDKDDIKVLRLSDIMLIAAEALYNLQDNTAINYLNMVAKQRDPLFAGYASTGSQLMEDILTERRKELAFEGSRLWDLIRLKRSWTKIKNQNPLATVAVDPSNIALILPVPVTEINANPNITQNPGY